MDATFYTGFLSLKQRSYLKFLFGVLLLLRPNIPHHKCNYFFLFLPNPEAKKKHVLKHLFTSTVSKQKTRQNGCGILHGFPILKQQSC